MLVRDILKVCSFANIVLDSEKGSLFSSAPVYLKYQGTTDKSALRRFGLSPVKEIFYDEVFTILI